MTLQEIVTRIHTGLGEPSDLPIYVFNTRTIDQAAVGWRRLVDAVNQFSLELCAWKFPNGHHLRMRLNSANALFQTKITPAVVTAASSGVVIVGGLGGTVDLYKDQLVVGATGSALIITSIPGVAPSTTLFVIKQSGFFTVGETVQIYTREYKWNPVVAVNPINQTGIPVVLANGKPLEIISITDVESEVSLKATMKTDDLSVVPNTVAEPTGIAKIQAGIRFNTWPVAGQTYMVRFMRGPRVLAYSDLDVEPELPVQFHGALELMGLWWGYRTDQESADAYSVKRDLYDYLARVQTEYDLQDELTSGQVKFYPEGR